jgi:hypothetical protein
VDLHAARRLLTAAGYVVLDPGEIATLRKLVFADNAHAVLGYIQAALDPPARTEQED